MKPWLQRSLRGTALVLALGAAAVCVTVWVAAQIGERRLQRPVVVGDVQHATFDHDTANVERGRYLYVSRGCTECHGVDGAGKTVIEDGGFVVRAPNISPGPGNVVVGYSGDDWNRIIRHGVKRSGQPAVIMPSEDYARLTDADLGAMVAYLRQMPPATGKAAEVNLPLPVRAMFGLGLIKLAAQKIDHRLPPPPPVPETVSAQHGSYVANSCIGCHGANLSGGKIPGAPPDWPAAAKLSPGADSAMLRYANWQAFAAMLRSGKRPDGSAVSAVMPFLSLKELNDTDVQALYLHLTAQTAAAAH
jgi:mono/diheme cytochrome c family protein